MKNKLYRLTVLGIEQTLKMKFFVILNIIMLVGIIGVVNFGTVKQIIEKNTGKGIDKNILKVMVQDETERFVDLVKLKEIKDIEVVDYSEQGVTEGKSLVEIKYSNVSIISAKITSNEYIEDNKYTELQNIINEIRTDIFVDKYDANLNEVQELGSNVKIERIVLTLNATDYVKYEPVVMVIAFIMYMLFIFVAATISSTIGIEKISKTTEYMLTGISEKAYLWYNILQVNIVFLIQMILSGVYYVFANIISSLLIIKFLDGSVGKIGEIATFSMDPILFKIVVLTLVQTVLCVLILSIVQAIMTSKVNNMTDISNSSMLVIMIVVLVCFVSPNIINVSETVNIFIKIVSCLPVLSIVMVPKLILLHQISNIGIVLAVLANVATLTFLSIFGSRWFKRGLLDSGNSKKSDKRKKDEIYDMNKSKFKETIFKVSIAMLMYLVISSALGFILIFIKGAFILSTNIASLINIIIWVASILPPYFYLKPLHVKSKEANKKVAIKDKINLLFSCAFLVIVIQFIISFIIKDNSKFDIVDLIGADFKSIIGILLFTIQVAILPAIFEELLFRGAMLKVLNKFGNLASILITAFCFGLMHQNLTQGIFAFLLGIILAFITIKTKSIIPAMIIHFLNNFVSVIAVIAAETNNNIMINIINISVYAVVLMSGLYFAKNILVNRKIFKLENTGIKIKNILSCIFTQYIVVITLLLYVIITIYMEMLLF
ncbi:MAG: family intrarane metalloprotease [Clostridia bacterium]|jgi:membrane protease YdiL (CAAX protease family)|nr:family intrarane metalloprotease [Clostridia bacterium]